MALRTEEGMEAEATLCSPISVRSYVPGHTTLGIASGALSPRICRSAQKRQKNWHVLVCFCSLLLVT